MIFGGVMQKKESPDFRFPKVGISADGNAKHFALKLDLKQRIG